ncbi:MAG: asparagine synthase (glutamine-hydrolyzing) [SAR324 cluster bacterium]|uniref:asparagine synthase (glutamine-hydrolyzing) n=1 Tax=SAR324 cluster bacterium TaxID=2024889 RepID=A0A2A4TAV5_9DELT|nr:MAG: asparagine synthase (glutamine-hydrolyzing) [SAR324 cluster bacterium]
MCGIVGFALKQGQPEEYPKRLVEMLKMVRHRGPDEMGYFFDNQIGLGSARLSIIDLKEGTQPISDSGENVHIVFNGEIFNYIELREELQALGGIFKTNSDTEVILQGYLHWGEKVCHRLNGQFAFCIYDRLKNILFLGRDNFGERPLFYTLGKQGFHFSSEVKGLFASPDVKRAIDSVGLNQVCHLWTTLPGMSVFDGVKQLRPGHAAIYDIAAMNWKEWAFFEPNFSEEPLSGSIEENIELTRSILEESVRLRLRSDVEVGTYLSGGLDSAIITYLATQLLGKKVHTFSVTFADHEFDESGFQNEVIQALGTTHHRVTIRNEDITQNFPELVWHAETPQFRTAAVPMFLLSRLVRESKIPVVLTGEGADEFFLGYNIFKETLLRKQFKQGNYDTASLLKLFPYLKHYSEENIGALVKFYSTFTDEETGGLFSHEPRFSNGLFSSRILREKKGDPKEDLSNMLYPMKNFKKLDSIQKGQILEINTLMAGYLLSSQGDRAGLAHSIEGRSPFLDKNVFELSCRLPRNQKLSEGQNEKYILKRAFSKVLPSAIINRQKQPYRAPDLLPFIQNTPSDYIFDLLKSVHIQQMDLFDRNFCERFIRKIYKAGSTKYSQRESQTFLTLYSTLIICDKFITNFRVPEIDIEPLIRKKIDGRGWRANR